MNQLIKANTVAEILNISLPTVYRLSRIGKLPVIRIGDQYRYSEKAISEWMENGGNQSEVRGCEVASA